MARDREAGSPGRAAKRADQLVPAGRHADGVAAGRRDAFRRRHGGPVGLALRASGLWPVLRHERIHFAVLGRQGSQGHPARDGHRPDAGDARLAGLRTRSVPRRTLDSRYVSATAG